MQSQRRKLTKTCILPYCVASTARSWFTCCRSSGAGISKAERTLHKYLQEQATSRESHGDGFHPALSLHPTARLVISARTSVSSVMPLCRSAFFDFDPLKHLNTSNATILTMQALTVKSPSSSSFLHSRNARHSFVSCIGECPGVS